MNSRKLLRNACASVAVLMSCASVHAVVPTGLFRAYVTSTGSDANPCTLPQPCRLLPAALAAVQDGGEIWMLDSANFNTGQVNVTKSVTILAIPGAVGSVVATGGGDAISINAAGAKVTLRNLVIVHLTSSGNGVTFLQGAELNVGECDIANVTGNGIYALAPAGKVAVRNTVLRGAQTGFYASGTVVASLDGVHAMNNVSTGIAASAGSRVTVSNSVMAGNNYGIYVDAHSGATRVVVERSAMTGNVYGIFAGSYNPGDIADVSATQNTVTHNITAGIHAFQAASTSATVTADGNTLSENNIGFSLSGSTIYTRGNNTLKFNTNDLFGGTLTALAGQ